MLVFSSFSLDYLDYFNVTVMGEEFPQKTSIPPVKVLTLLEQVHLSFSPNLSPFGTR